MTQIVYTGSYFIESDSDTDWIIPRTVYPDFELFLRLADVKTPLYYAV